MDIDINKMAADLTPPEDAEAVLLQAAEASVEADARSDDTSEEVERALQRDGNPHPTKAVDTITDPNPDMTEPEEVEEKEYHVYLCARPTMHMHTPEGRDIRFHDGKCITDNEEVIEYLESELRAGNRFITVDKEKPVMTSSDLDPMSVIRRNMRKELLAELAAEAAANKPRDMGGTGVKVNIPSSADMGELAGDSNS